MALNEKHEHFKTSEVYSSTSEAAQGHLLFIFLFHTPLSFAHFPLVVFHLHQFLEIFYVITIFACNILCRRVYRVHRNLAESTYLYCECVWVPNHIHFQCNIYRISLHVIQLCFTQFSTLQLFFSRVLCVWMFYISRKVLFHK